MKTLTIAFLFAASIASAQQAIVEQANQFLSSLSKEQRSKAFYRFDDAERFRWHFVPRERNGISLHDLSEAQTKAVYTLVTASLSKQGADKAKGIIALEKILQRVEGRSADDAYRDPKKYYFTIFGEPSFTAPWAWRLEGHHLSVNFSSVGGTIVSSTPSFMGSNPATVPAGDEKGRRVLKEEMDQGFALVQSLTAQQQKAAVFSNDALPEIITGNDRHATLLSPAGIAYAELTSAQQNAFLQLLDVYVRNYELGFSNKLMAKIKKAGIDKLTFAWAGSLNPGAGHYYRIQGPMLLIEYDNTQNNANHIHTVVRDLTNDFAEDILREHYAKEHGNR